MDKVSIATSSGGLWLALVTHFGSALIALVAGTIALVVAKGSRLHKKSGMVFTDAPPMTAEQLIMLGLLSHIDDHMGSIRKTVGM